MRQAIELGVNLFDTAAAYGTETVLGKAIKDVPRDQVVICTKAPFSWISGRADPGRASSPASTSSLRQLDLDYIDVYQLHGVPPAHYDHALANWRRCCCASATRASSAFSASPRPRRNDLDRTTRCTAPPQDKVWDVVHGRVFDDAPERPHPRLPADPRARRRHALDVRGAQHLLAAGPPRRDVEGARGRRSGFRRPRATTRSGFLVHPGGASSVVDAAYRYVRHEPGVDVVLFGTGSPDHLKTNIDSLLKPPLPEADHRRIGELFGHLVGVGLDAPHLSRAGQVR